MLRRRARCAAGPPPRVRQPGRRRGRDRRGGPRAAGPDRRCRRPPRRGRRAAGRRAGALAGAGGVVGRDRGRPRCVGAAADRRLGARARSAVHAADRARCASRWPAPRWPSRRCATSCIRHGTRGGRRPWELRRRDCAPTAIPPSAVEINRAPTRARRARSPAGGGCAPTTAATSSARSGRALLRRLQCPARPSLPGRLPLCRRHLRPAAGGLQIFRYGQCNTQVRTARPRSCAGSSMCENPAQSRSFTAVTAVEIDDAVCGQTRPCLEPPDRRARPAWAARREAMSDADDRRDRVLLALALRSTSSPCCAVTRTSCDGWRRWRRAWRHRAARGRRSRMARR